MSGILDRKDIIGTYTINSDVSASRTVTDDSVLRVQFIKSNSSNYTYENVKFCVVLAEGVKVFVAIYYNRSGNAFPLIQIPLFGQPISDLCNSINAYSDIVASPVNGYGYLNSMFLNETAFTVSYGNELFFEADTKVVNSTFEQIQKDIRFYLTSPEALAEQRNLVQSYGGYRSTSEVYKGFVLRDTLGIYDPLLTVDETSISNNFTLLDLQKAQYVQIDDEIIEISRWSGTIGYIAHRSALNTGLRMHPAGSVVREIYKNNFFDKNFSDARLQYRCICVRNENANFTAKDMRLFFNTQDSNNLADIKIAIEIPSSDYYTGASSSTGFSSFTVDTLAGLFYNDYFVGAPITFTTGSNIGQKRFIKNYIANSGNLILDQRLPYNVAIGDQFYIDTAPATRTKSPHVKPLSSRISDFFAVGDYNNSIEINTQGIRTNGNDLGSYEAIYVWFERSINVVNDEYKDNRFSLSLSYSRV